MAAIYINEYGSITVSDKVIAKIVSEAVYETYGIVGMAAKNTKDGIYELLNLENATKGVEVKTDENNKVNIRISVIIEYGVRISVVAENIIDKVKYYVEKNTGLDVNSITIRVEGIRV